MTDVRALAAQGLAEVALDGASLSRVAATLQPKLQDSRDRALLTALLHEGARWWLRFDPAVQAMLSRPLPRREGAVRALMVLGLVQLEVLELPSYAAVAATVNAVRALGRPRMSGLCNALLRRWQRERETRLAALDADDATRYACPTWLIGRLREDWPGEADTVLAENNRSAPPMLRVNRRKLTRKALLDRLHAADVAARAHAWLDDAIVLDGHRDITALPGFGEGAFSVQDGAAQVAATLLEAGDGQRVLDACAAPGGKTAHILERAAVDMLALDRDPARLERVRQNLDRLGLACSMCAADAGAPDAWWDGRAFDRILLDAPCSATGVIRRHPDIKLHRRAADIPVLADSQLGLLSRLWPLLAPGGRLLYATCSILHAENSAVIARFTADRDDVRIVSPPLPAGCAAGAGRQLLPGRDGVDGMFYAILDKSHA